MGNGRLCGGNKAPDARVHLLQKLRQLLLPLLFQRIQMLEANRRTGVQAAVYLTKPCKHLAEVNARTVDVDKRIHPALGIPVNRDGHIQPSDTRIAGKEYGLHRRAERMGNL